jgi:hypothetical protein
MKLDFISTAIIGAGLAFVRIEVRLRAHPIKSEAA